MNNAKPESADVVIVGVTHAGDEGGHRLCVGALGVDGTPYRLHSMQRNFQPPTIKIAVGEKFRLDLVPYDGSAPHVEGVRVAGGTRTGRLDEPALLDFIESRVEIMSGGFDALFDGLLAPQSAPRDSRRSLGVRDKETTLRRSVEFARLDFNLTLEEDQKYFTNDDRSLKVRWVGQDEPPAEVRAGTLVRFSLATWWGTPPHDAYYLQLSGVFD